MTMGTRALLYTTAAAFTAAMSFGATYAYGEYAEAQARESMKDTFADLDGKTTEVFNSVANCVAQGHDAAMCQESNDAALKIFNDTWRRYADLQYPTLGQCEAVHSMCNTTTVRSGWTSKTSFTPAMSAAWLALHDNILEAVPLYVGPTPDSLVRLDLKQVSYAAEPRPHSQPKRLKP